MSTLADEFIPIDETSMEGFRQRLAGLTVERVDEIGHAEFRPVAIRIILLLAEHYNRDQLDPKSLWSRIESAIKTGIEKDDGDIAIMLNAMLEHVKADAEHVSRDSGFASILEDVMSRPDQFVGGLCNYFRKALLPLITFGRIEWKKKIDDSKKKHAKRKAQRDEIAEAEREVAEELRELAREQKEGGE